MLDLATDTGDIAALFKSKYPELTVTGGGILLTHVPLFGMLDGTPDGNNYGSRTVRRILEELQPDFLVCGHVHQSFGKESINGTTVINCGSIQDNPLQILNMDNLNTYRI